MGCLCRPSTFVPVDVCEVNGVGALLLFLCSVDGGSRCASVLISAALWSCRLTLFDWVQRRWTPGCIEIDSPLPLCLSLVVLFCCCYDYFLVGFVYLHPLWCTSSCCRAIHAFLARHMYHRRCKVDPLWNSVLVAGYHKGEGYVFAGVDAVVPVSGNFLRAHVSDGPSCGSRCWLASLQVIPTHCCLDPISHAGGVGCMANSYCVTWPFSVALQRQPPVRFNRTVRCTDSVTLSPLPLHVCSVVSCLPHSLPMTGTGRFR